MGSTSVALKGVNKQLTMYLVIAAANISSSTKSTFPAAGRYLFYLQPHKSNRGNGAGVEPELLNILP